MGTIDHVIGYCAKCKSSSNLRVILDDSGRVPYPPLVIVENHPCPIKGCNGTMEYD